MRLRERMLTTTPVYNEEDKTELDSSQMTWSMAEPAIQTIHQLARLARAVQSRKFPLVKRDITHILTAYSQSCASSASSSSSGTASICSPSASCTLLTQDSSSSFSSQFNQSMPAPPVLVVTALDSILRGSDLQDEARKEELLDAYGAVLLEGLDAAVVAAPVVTGKSKVFDARKIGAAILSDALENNGQVHLWPRLILSWTVFKCE